MEKKQEEHARQMRELQDHTKHLQLENDSLRAQVEKMNDLGEKDMQDSSQTRHLTARNKGNEPIILDNIDTPVDDELSSGSSPDLSPAKTSRARSGQRCSHHPAFINVDSGTFNQLRRQTSRR